MRCLATIIWKVVVVGHNGLTREEPLRPDLQGEGCVVLEAKAVREVLPTHKAHLPSQTKLLNAPIVLHFSNTPTYPPGRGGGRLAGVKRGAIPGISS